MKKFMYVLVLFLVFSLTTVAEEPCVEINAPTIDTLMVTVEYDMALEQMIEAGEYDFVNDDITVEHFPLNKRENDAVELYILHFDYGVTTEQVLRLLDIYGLRPAELSELLSLGIYYPDIQRDHPLVALGSEWQSTDGHVNIPILREFDGQRKLSLYWNDPNNTWWISYHRFVAVCK